MRKLATLAAVALSTGAALAGGASTAGAVINLGAGTSDTDPSAATNAVSGTLGIANTWCGAPWLWTGQQADAGCEGTQHHNPPTE